jgi:hypothetical protein
MGYPGRDMRFNWFRLWKLRRVPAAICCIASSGLTFASGCGSAGTPGGDGTGLISGQTTKVTVLVSSTANDQISEFNLFLNSLTLTSESGKTVSVLSSPQYVEFIHLNGGAEPLLTMTVPQDVYTSATATVGAANMSCVLLNVSKPPLGVVESSILYGYTPNSQVTVTLPSPITVAGAAMGLSLNLLVSESGNYANCIDPSLPAALAITPTFVLSAFQISGQPVSPASGAMAALAGIVASVDAAKNEFTVTAIDGSGLETTQAGVDVHSSGIVWSADLDSSASLQGISDISALEVGMPVDMDGMLQPDGSLRVSRVAVADTNPTDLTVESGPVVEVTSYVPAILQLDRGEEGYLVAAADPPFNPEGMWAFDKTGAKFRIGGEFTNLPSLPFTAAFDSESAVAGQNVSITLHAPSLSNLTPATTFTLMSQTIDGTLNAIGTAGSFTLYTVKLAPYDLFPTLAFTNSYQSSPLTSADTVYVYADSNAQMLNTEPATVGGVLRFTGVVFNDNGTLRMDCSQVMDGVPE